MGLFEKFLGFAANNQKKVVASMQMATRGLPWAIGCVCVFGGVYGLPAYLGITYPKEIIAKLTKEKHLPEAYTLWWILTNWEKIDEEKYNNILALNRGMTPTKMQSLLEICKIK